jgi:hypothetical protein
MRGAAYHTHTHTISLSLSLSLSLSPPLSLSLSPLPPSLSLPPSTRNSQLLGECAAVLLLPVHPRSRALVENDGTPRNRLARPQALPAAPVHGRHSGAR